VQQRCELRKLDSGFAKLELVFGTAYTSTFSSVWNTNYKTNVIMCPTIIRKIIAIVEKDNKSGIFEKDK